MPTFNLQDIFFRCLNANKDSVEVLGVPPQDPSSDYGVEWMGGVPYIEVANSEEIQVRQSERERGGRRYLLIPHAIFLRQCVYVYVN